MFRRTVLATLAATVLTVPVQPEIAFAETVGQEKQDAASPETAKPCDADVLVYSAATDSYACGEFRPIGRYHKTVFSNDYRSAARIEEYDSFKACAAESVPDIRAIQANDGGFYVVNGVFCVEQVD